MKKKSFLTNAAIYGIGGIALQVAGFILLPLYTRYLSVEEFGVLDLIQRTGQIILICLMVNGIRMATLTFYQQAETEQERESVAATQSFLVFTTLLVLGTVAFWFAKPIARLVGVEDEQLFAFGIVAVIIEATIVIPLALIQARIESWTFVLVNISMLVTRVSLILVFLVLFEWGIWGVLTATAITSGIFGLTLTARELRKGALKIDLRRIPEVLRFTLPFLPGGILAFIMLSSDRFILNQLLGLEKLGVYALAAKLAGVVGLLSIGPLYRVWSAMMYSAAEESNAAETFGAMYCRLMSVYIFLGTLLCVFVPEVLLIFGSAKYSAAIYLLPPLVLAQFFYSASCVLDAAFYVKRKTAIKPWITLVATIATVEALFVFIPMFGLTGGAYGLALAFFVLWLATLILAQRTLWAKIDWPRQLGFLAISAALVALLLSEDVSVYRFTIKTGSIIIWGLVIWFAPLVSNDDKQILGQQLQRLRSSRVFNRKSQV